jgi:beta-glucuronidase
MLRKLWTTISVLLFLLGGISLALTLYLWFGDWPQEAKQTVEHFRSVAERRGRAPDPAIANVYARKTTPLNGTWPAVIDPYGRAELGGMAPRALEPQHESDLAEFSFENGLTLDVPGDWNTQDPRLVFYQGIAWYKREFHHTPSSGARHFVYFGAVNYRAAVYLNGLLLGEHLGGFTPFNFEVTDQLREGENLLVVKVDSEKGPEDVPTPTTDWLNYGGITRDVLLLELPGTFIRSYELKLAEGGDGIVGWVQLDGIETSPTVRVSIPELGVEREAETDPSGKARFEIAAKPERWSPDSPKLYGVELSAGQDTVRDKIGFREIAVRGDEILLNGEPLFLRGISLHEEAPFDSGRSQGRGDAKLLLGWARELGCNFVRLAHYPHDEHTSRVADEMGMLVWAEIPVYWNVDFANDYSLELAKTQLSELIGRDRNRASVVLWSIANETPQTPERLRFLETLAAHVRSEDPSRLVTAAMLTGAESLGGFFLRHYIPALFGLRFGDWVMEVNDPLVEAVDVPAVNEYFGWYYVGALAAVSPVSSHYARRVMLENMHRIRIDIAGGKPWIASELGAGAKAGFHVPEARLAAYSEEYQALVYRKQIEMLEQQRGLSGMSPWLLKDFRSPLRLYQGVQDHWNLKGLYSDEGKKKQAFGVLQRHYVERARREERS